MAKTPKGGAAKAAATTPVKSKTKTTAKKGPVAKNVDVENESPSPTPSFSTPAPQPANSALLSEDLQENLEEEEETLTAAETPTQPKVSSAKLITNVKALLADLQTVGVHAKDKARAKKILDELEEAMNDLEKSLEPAGWTMQEFLVSEGLKTIAYLNKTKLATEESFGIALNFESLSRYVCIACFNAGYRPASCIFKNLVGFMGHRKKGLGDVEVYDPCLAPATITAWKKRTTKLGKVTRQPAAIEHGPNLYKLYTKFKIPINMEEHETCIVHLEAGKIHHPDVVYDYHVAQDAYKAKNSAR